MSLHLNNMVRLTLSILLISFGWIMACSLGGSHNSESSYCDCDTLKTKEIISSRTFNAIPQYDTSTFKKDAFYELDTSVNRALWYRDIESIDTTKFTNLWNDYSPYNYHASHLDFVQYYDSKKDIELAFQFGPNMDLWAYHIFVVKKVECCFLITRSYFRHARFTFKAYDIITNKELDSLYVVLGNLKRHPVGNVEEFKYRGYFVDNRNKRQFFVEFENDMNAMNPNSKRQEPGKEIKALYDFVDKKINWKKTYVL